jgi:hypothetical protein
VLIGLTYRPRDRRSIDPESGDRKEDARVSQIDW